MNDISINSNLTKEEIGSLVKGLSKLRPGYLPLPIFLEIVRLTVTPTVEICFFRLTKDGSPEILLTKRDGSDPTWPGMFHVPGTVIRASDKVETFEDAFERIMVDELRNVKIVGKPVFVKPFFRQSTRGKDVVLMHWAVIEKEPSVGKFFKIDSLPENFIKEQINSTKVTAEHFVNNYKKN